jgi:hypothetical protein
MKINKNYTLTSIEGKTEKVKLVTIKQEKIFDDENETFPMAIVQHANGALTEENPNKLS